MKFTSRASLTVECALSLPLFFFAMTTMISFMDLYRTETVHLTDLCGKAKQAAAFTYNPASSGGVKDIILPDHVPPKKGRLVFKIASLYGGAA